MCRGDRGVFASDDAFAQQFVHDFLGDVGGIVSALVRVAVEHVDLAEATGELCEAVGTMVRAGEEKEKFDRLV